MSRQVESHFINTGFPVESYIYLFEGLPHNYSDISSSAVMHDQERWYWPMQTGPHKFEPPSGPGNTSYRGVGHAHVEDDHVPPNVDESEYFVTIPASPDEHTRGDSNATSPQVFWQNNIDVDNMTYEELLDLGEAVGTQSRGLSEELIAKLPTSKYKAGGFFNFSRKKSHGDQCVICQMEYKRGDRQITLPCKHVYHAKCATKWLSINKACPVCYIDVFGDDSKR